MESAIHIYIHHMVLLGRFPQFCGVYCNAKILESGLIVADGLKIVVDLGENYNDGIKILSCKIKLLNNCYLYKN
jgi:hypothetical protein